MSTLKANRYENTASSDGGIDIDSSGKLGFGTSSPKEVVDSRGAAVFSGDHATSQNAYGTAHGIMLSSSNNLASVKAVSNGSNDVAIRFIPLSSGSGSEAIRILAGGGLTFNGDTAAANALDDYEEGTFTGSFNNQDNDATVSHGNQTGFYVKIGNLVHFSLYFDDIDVTSTGSIANAHIFGLPFTSLGTSQHYSIVNIIHNTILTSAAGGYVNTNSTVVIPVDEGSTTTSTFSTGTNKRLMVGGTYRAA